MAIHEFQWLHYAPGASGKLFLGKANTINDLFSLMHKTNYPKPQFSKMYEVLRSDDVFSYLLDQWHVHRVKVTSASKKLKELADYEPAPPKKIEVNSFKFYSENPNL
jgi:hypothetical protein